MNEVEARQRLLAAAEMLFYQRGIQAVGMDELRTTAGVSLKRLYQCFPSKQQLVEVYLENRDEQWRGALATYVERSATDPKARLLAIFDWLNMWFTQPDFRGCAFINSFGELGGVSAGVVNAARHHKAALQQYITDLTEVMPVSEPDALAKQLFLLLEGAITTAAIAGNANAATDARSAATSLISAATTEP